MDSRTTPFLHRVRNAWNAFRDRSDKLETWYDIGPSYAVPYHRSVMSVGNEQSIVSSVYNRCAIDVSQLQIRHVYVDENGNYLEDVQSKLNKCLNLSANIDQTGRALIQDIVISMFDEGTVAVVPVDTTKDIENNNAFDVLSLRTGQIIDWFPQHVRVRVYNDQAGTKEELVLPKAQVAIIENPLYSVMNEPNSTLKRLINKLNLLDAIDEQSGSGKLDLIIQLPYIIKSEQRRQQAEQRLAALEAQLKGSQYGVAYADGTEKIIQLNRPAENNLMGQIEYLTSMLYSQLGMSDEIFSGTASPEQLLQYYNRTVEPVASAIATEFKRKFLTQTAITQGQSISVFRNPFSLVTATDLAELADKFTRNEILTGNEFRAVIGFKPSDDPSANELRNKNLNVPEEKPIEGENQNGSKP